MPYIALHPDAAKAFKRWKAWGSAKYVGWRPPPTDPAFPDRGARCGGRARHEAFSRIKLHLAKADVLVLPPKSTS